MSILLSTFAARIGDARRASRRALPWMTEKESPQAVERLRAKTYSKEVEMIVSNRIMDAALRVLAGVALALLLTGVAPVALAALAIGALA